MPFLSILQVFQPNSRKKIEARRKINSLHTEGVSRKLNIGDKNYRFCLFVDELIG